MVSFSELELSDTGRSLDGISGPKNPASVALTGLL
jgi:hypothetical protein